MNIIAKVNKTSAWVNNLVLIEILRISPDPQELNKVIKLKVKFFYSMKYC